MSTLSDEPLQIRQIKLHHIVITFVASVVITGQSSVNAELNKYTDNALFTAILVFISGLLVLIALLIAKKPARDSFLSIRHLVRLGELKWWQLAGGLSGATFVAIQSDLVAATGVAIFTISAVAGQTAGALFVDKIGIGPAGKRAITVARVFSALLGVVGVVISVAGQASQANFAIGGVLLTFAAGCFVSTQPALNGTVAIKTGHALAATTMNFVVGLVTLLVVFGVVQLIHPATFTIPPSPMHNPLIWMGGPFGVFFVLVAAYMARTLGVFVFTLASVLGQLSGAILIDMVFPTSATHITAQLLIGLVVTGSAVVLASVTSKSS